MAAGRLTCLHSAVTEDSSSDIASVRSANPSISDLRIYEFLACSDSNDRAVGKASGVDFIEIADNYSVRRTALYSCRNRFNRSNNGAKSAGSNLSVDGG
jgi:hypothetical protein